MSLAHENQQQEIILRAGHPQYSMASIRSGETLSQLIHKVGHDIGNPLTSIISFSTILERLHEASAGPADLLKASEYASSIIGEAWKIGRLSERLVMLLSLRPANHSPCRVDRSLSSALGRLRSRYGYREARVSASLDAHSSQLITDAEQFQCLLVELLANACSAEEAVKENKKTPDEPEPIMLDTEFRDNEMKLILSNPVSQTCPIDLNRIFDPFVTEHSDKKHIGLGLTVAWSIVDRLGGKIEAREIEYGGKYRFAVQVNLPSVALP